MITYAAVPPDLAARLPAAVHEMLDEFRQTTGYDVQLYDAPEGAPGDAMPVEVGGQLVYLRVSGGDGAPAAARFLVTTLQRVERHETQMSGIILEIAERYEEITLLYSISEILGATISLEAAAGTILSEVVSTLGARRATLWVHDQTRDLLERAAVVGDSAQLGPIAVTDPCSLTAEVFREGRPTILRADEARHTPGCDPVILPPGPFVSVPVSYTPPEGEPRTIGVINVTGRVADEPFSAGDVKLLAAIASQIGAAVENNRLIFASLRQERMVRELELAHDLQLKLLPPLEEFAGYADVAARCAPAESVGGDFYHLFRLPGGRLGVMIGDVSSHGFGAALIMALTMSAVAIHAGEGDPPAIVLKRVHRALIGELTNTEMYLTLFYSVIDPKAGTITYANAGHPYAFRVCADGTHERLSATNPPLGMVDLDDYQEGRTAWESGKDLLFLFTDGLSDALETSGVSGEDALLEEVARGLSLPPQDLLERLFSLEHGRNQVPADDRTAVLMRL